MSAAALLCAVGTSVAENGTWRIDSQEEWKAACAKSEGLEFEDGMVAPVKDAGSYTSVIEKFDKPLKLASITFSQSPVWENWDPVGNVGPANLGDAPVMLVMGPDDYWMFGRYGSARRRKGDDSIRAEAAFVPKDATLEGFDVPLKTTPYEHQYDAPGGLMPKLGGYHAWQSRDMKNWIHHGPVTEKFSCWVTTAEQVDGKVYIYYDYPNDQDPHLYIDDDLTDGKPGKNMGIAFKDPSDGSDCTFIRDLKGNFHVIYEDWTPINAQKHSWDSSLAGHAVSADGIKDFEILTPAVDERTKPTGEKATYRHPHWMQHPDWKSNVAEYEVHEPEQNAFGDWAAICIGGQYYLFCDYHPANDKIRVGWFTSPDINQKFSFCGELGLGHPDPEIAFAEGQFYLITQTPTDYVSPGPWVAEVEARVGVDAEGDGKIDQWTEWQKVSEKYDYIKGFSKQVKRFPASINLTDMPEAHGVAFEFRLKDSTKNVSKPSIDSVTVLSD